MGPAAIGIVAVFLEERKRRGVSLSHLITPRELREAVGRADGLILTFELDHLIGPSRLIVCQRD
jgi:hypothetical protein